MTCSRCSSSPVWREPRLCADHFTERFEETVRGTIRRYRLFRRSDRVCVACSGGKDSTALLFLLAKLGYDVTALAVDEGIAGYRDGTLAFLRRFCDAHAIPLLTVSFAEAYGRRLDETLRDGLSRHPCTLCGTLRRQLLNKAARHPPLGARFDVLATGHNADDEAQAVLMNLCRAQTALLPRSGPASRSAEQGFVRRVKPLFFQTEKEVLLYALLHGLASAWEECPYAPRAYRSSLRDALNAYEERRPGAKRRLLAHALRRRRAPGSTTRPCATCGEPSTEGACKACRLLEGKE